MENNRSTYFVTALTEAYIATTGDFEATYEQVEFLDAPQQAQVYRRAILNLSNTKQGVEQSRLEMLWMIYSLGLVVYMGEGGAEYNPEDFPQWVSDELSEYETRDYNRRIANVVVNILQDVHVQHVNGKPYLGIYNEEITADLLISLKRITGKLMDIAPDYPTWSDAERQNVLAMIVSGVTREVVKEEVESIRSGKTKIMIPYFEEYGPNNTYIITMSLSADQRNLLLKLIEKVSEPVLEIA